MSNAPSCPTHVLSRVPTAIGEAASQCVSTVFPLNIPARSARRNTLAVRIVTIPSSFFPGDIEAAASDEAGEPWF